MIGAALDRETTVVGRRQTLVRTLVDEGLADMARFVEISDGQATDGLAIAAHTPEQEAKLRGLNVDWMQVGRTVTAGRVRRYDVDEAFILASSTDERQRELRRSMRFGTVALVPLSARGQTSGLLAVARTRNSAPFDDGDTALLADLAERAATALDNALLLEREQANRARALIWLHMGRNAASVPDTDKLADLPPSSDPRSGRGRCRPRCDGEDAAEPAGPSLGSRQADRDRRASPHRQPAHPRPVGWTASRRGDLIPLIAAGGRRRLLDAPRDVRTGALAPRRCWRSCARRRCSAPGCSLRRAPHGGRRRSSARSSGRCPARRGSSTWPRSSWTTPCGWARAPPRSCCVPGSTSTCWPLAARTRSRRRRAGCRWTPDTPRRTRPAPASPCGRAAGGTAAGRTAARSSPCRSPSAARPGPRVRSCCGSPTGGRPSPRRSAPRC